MFNSRPYRHVPTPRLIALRDAMIADIQFGIEYGLLISDSRRELRRISRELDRRSEETL